MNIKITSKMVAYLVLVVCLGFYFIGVYWSFEPAQFNVKVLVQQQASAEQVKPVVGYATTTALIKVSETLLDKPGGYLSNDVMPPSVFLDNIPSWEFGALEMVRDLSLAMRQEFSRSQSQSVENQHLKIAQPEFNIDNKSWAMPSAEREYRKAINQLYAYRKSLADVNSQDAQFYARADNLRDWLQQVQSRLGSYSQRLSASVGREQLNVDLAGDNAAQQSTANAGSKEVKTNWLQVDNVFYEARGASWALLHFLQAIQIDFHDVLEKKNATVSVQQIIRELQESQQTVWSPMVLNGSGFGYMANYSLVMANYISRANAAIIDLNELLSKG